MTEKSINILRKIAAAQLTKAQEAASQDAAKRGLRFEPINPNQGGETRVIRLPGINGGKPTPVFLPDSVKKQLEEYRAKKAQNSPAPDQKKKYTDYKGGSKLAQFFMGPSADPEFQKLPIAERRKLIGNHLTGKLTGGKPGGMPWYLMAGMGAPGWDPGVPGM